MTDHDAIAARVRQDRMSGTMLTGPVYIKLADMAAAYLDLYDEVQRLRADRMEVFGDHAHVVRGIIAAAGALPDMHDGPFREGFISGIEEVAARADIHAGDGGRQMLDLAGQIVDLVHGDACIVMLTAAEVIAKLARAEKAEAERDRLRAVLERCPPTSNPTLSAEYHLERINAWWRLDVHPALAKIKGADQ